MNKKLLLGALIGAGMSMLNKKIRQQSAPAPGTPPPDFHRPDFSKVPPPEQTGGAGGPNLDDILARAGQPGGWNPGNGAGAGQGPGGDIFGGAVPAGAGAGGAAVLMEIARRIFAQMQQSGGAAPGGGMGRGSGAGMDGGLGDVLGQIFGRAGGKFGQQGPQGPQSAPGNWQSASPRGKGGLFGFVNTADEGGSDAGDGEAQADAMLKAMIAAAQADGRIDEAEQRNILQALDGQLEASALDAFRQFLTQPVSMDYVVSAAHDPATAFNLYLVSAMTINPDNAQEKQYLETLAEKLGISEQAAHAVEQQLPR
ncbi:tellurite resistance TerB family protein [Microbulbifer sp. YPW1]|uniref:tellurite resistance TerB family protein n=1 Tax=Microbulbifer sp. YPW1 TaxID=2745199 RepID=UPI00159B3F33|nr:tellurite resistance TerB family protein [Microbulbifer sp. YPW1]QKX15586.1 tellurite resistance TerB family protein [Microbulbifer sp. YPW1]